MIVLDSIRDPRLAALLNSGGVGVLPTDTIYGLAAKADDASAVARVGRLKGHGQRSGTVIAASVEQLVELGVKESVVQGVAHLWPNPLSIELPLGENLAHLHQDGAHRAFRVVADADVRSLLEKTGPLITSSANLHGEPPANNIEEAQLYFGDQVDFYVDGGDLSGRPPSTVARFSDGRLEVLRQGAVRV